jgi:CheY-like chemotaxis protein
MVKSDRASVVFVDDDRFYAFQWIEKLEEKFDVKHFVDADEARSYIRDGRGVDCIVLDVMMPTPLSVSSGETADGFETGLWLLGQIANQIQDRTIPVIVLTNRDADRVTEQVDGFNFQPGLVVVRHKTQTDRKRLLQIVTDMVSKWS